MGHARVVHVTGGARGIGLALVEAFARRGDHVAVSDLDGPAAEAVAAALERRGLRALGLALDVADAGAVDAAAARIAATLGPIDVWVNNAGVMALGAFLEQDRARDALQLRVNLGGALNGARAALPAMVARGSGHLVNLASVAGRVGTAHAAVYSATKHAVIGLSEALSAELAGTGVHVTYVCPSVVTTELVAGLGRVRWPRAVTADEVAAATLRAIDRRQVEVYVPAEARASTVLPALLPRGLVAWLSRALGVDALFRAIDPGARAGYERRAFTAPAGGPSAAAPLVPPDAPPDAPPEAAPR